VFPRILGVFSCLLVALAVAACGSSSSKSSTSASPSKSSSTSSAVTTPGTSSSNSTTSTPRGSAATGAAIKLGMICSCSGVQAAALGQSGFVIEAWAKSVNASGGVNGHPVDVIVKDDGSNPATGLQDAKALVEQDHIVAMVGEMSLVDGSWATYIAQQGIPVVGGLTIESTFLSNPDFYPSGSQIVGLLAGDGALAKQAGKKSLGLIYCAESPICAQLVPIGEGIAKLNGLKSFAEKISATAPSYAAPCLAAKSAGVDALFLGTNGTIGQRFTDACAQQGYKPTQTNSMEAAVPTWLKDANFTGALLDSTNANTFDTSTPAVQAFQTALNKYAPGLVSGPQFQNDTILPWAGGQLFLAAAKAANLTPTSTAADVKKGLYALKNEALGGLAPPLTFTPGKPSFIPCYFSATITGGKFVSQNGDKPTCLSTAQATALGQALAKAG
jgi:branched-chain amino acid transport system substrate-binding protein